MTLGPETKAIIEAINGLKPNKEKLNYQIITICLADARSAALGNDEIALPGSFDTLTVGKLTGSAILRINERGKDAIDLAYVKSINTPIQRLFLTNEAQRLSELVLALGGDASFSADPIRTGRKIFTYQKLDEDGALNVFETSQAKTVLPTFMVDTFRDPPDLKEGVLTKIKVRFDPANIAVTYTLRLWTDAVNGAVTPYAQELVCIYEMDFPGLHDIAYTIVLNRPIRLPVAGAIWYSVEWSAAPGNTPGALELQGDQFR
jgi:hypothetical protein